MKKRMLGAPCTALAGSGQAGVDSDTVRPMTPGKVVPGLYSFKLAIIDSPFLSIIKLIAN